MKNWFRTFLTDTHDIIAHKEGDRKINLTFRHGGEIVEANLEFQTTAIRDRVFRDIDEDAAQRVVDDVIKLHTISMN